MDLLDRMLQHDLWATRQLLSLCRDLSDEQLDQEFDIGHRSVRETFHHMVFNAEYWMSAMDGRNRPPRPGGLGVAALAEEHERSYDAISTLARRIQSEQRMDEIFTDHHKAPMSYGGAFVQFIYHNNEHRTEIVHMLGRLGVLGDVEVDYGLWDFARRGLI